jgi:large subunit ribosomal protein L23
MAILDIFKRKPRKVSSEQRGKKLEEKPADKLKPIEKPSEVEPPKIKKDKKDKKDKKERRVAGEAYRVLKTPHVTEKATGLVGQNQYIFKIWPRANKTETKKAIEDIYGVDVISVKIIKVPRKRRRLGKISGWRKGYKKAIVRIKKGQKIDVLSR